MSPKIIFVEADAVKLIESTIREDKLETEIVVFDNSDTHVSFSEYLVSSGKEEEFKARPVDNIHDTAVIFFSSGTTGLPKGIMAPHYGLLYSNTYFS